MADAPKSFFLSPEIQEYLVAHGTPPDAVQQALIEETAALGGISMMQISPEQGAFMTLLTRLVGAQSRGRGRHVHRLLARCASRAGSPPTVTCSAATSARSGPSVGRKYWEQAGVADRIELRIAPAVDTLRALPPSETIDLAFVDADKPNYARLLRGDAAAAAAERRDPRRQRALGRQRDRPTIRTTRTGSRSARSTTWSRPTTGSRP